MNTWRRDSEAFFFGLMSPYDSPSRRSGSRAYDADEWLEFYFTGLDYILSLNRSGYAFTEILCRHNPR